MHYPLLTQCSHREPCFDKLVHMDIIISLKREDLTQKLYSHVNPPAIAQCHLNSDYLCFWGRILLLICPYEASFCTLEVCQLFNMFASILQHKIYYCCFCWWQMLKSPSMTSLQLTGLGLVCCFKTLFTYVCEQLCGWLAGLDMFSQSRFLTLDFKFSVRLIAWSIGNDLKFRS